MGFVIWKLQELFWTMFYRSLWPLFFQSLGRGCRFEGWIELTGRGGIINIGSGVRIRRNVEFTVASGAILKIHDYAFIGRGVVISSHGTVVLGKSCLIAEYVCIHDNNHAFANPRELIVEQGFDKGTCIVGDGAWVGAGCKLLMNSAVGDNSVLGAGAVLTRALPAGIVAHGNPARVARAIAPVNTHSVDPDPIVSRAPGETA